MNKRSLQEWANFTGMYVVETPIGIGVCWEEKPYVKDGHWVVDNNYQDSMAIPSYMFVPFQGDWKGSLHEPQKTCPDCENDYHDIWDKLKMATTELTEKEVMMNKIGVSEAEYDNMMELISELSTWRIKA